MALAVLRTVLKHLPLTTSCADPEGGAQTSRSIPRLRLCARRRAGWRATWLL